MLMAAAVYPKPLCLLRSQSRHRPWKSFGTTHYAIGAIELLVTFNYAAPTAKMVTYTLTDTRDEIVFDWSNPQFSRAEDLNNISIWFVAYTSAPARRAGNVVLVHETLNMAKEGRKAWTYSPGTRRVRRAPNIAYDNPVTNGDGLGNVGPV